MAMPSYMSVSAYVVVQCWLLYLNFKLSLGKLSDLSKIGRASGAVIYLLKPKGQGRGHIMGLFYCFNTLWKRTDYPLSHIHSNSSTPTFPLLQFPSAMSLRQGAIRDSNPRLNLQLPLMQDYSQGFALFRHL
jgi:hypothetical protein